MNYTELAPKGTFPDIIYFNGDEYVIAQVGEKLILWRNRQILQTYPLPQEGQAFARFGPRGDFAWRYDDGILQISSVTEPGITFSYKTQVWGNEPIVVTEGAVYWQTPQRVVYIPIRNANYPPTPYNPEVLPTGLSRFSPSNTLIYVDDDRLIWTPAGLRTRPSYVSPDSYVVEGRDNNGCELWHKKDLTVLWPNKAMFVPRIVAKSANSFVVVAWGDHLGLVDINIQETPQMRPPGITIDNYDKKLTSNNSWKLRWHDRNNGGFSGTVEFINGSVHVSFKNPQGEDRSGAKRPVEITDGEPSQPPLPFPNPPSQGLREWRGNFLALPGFEYAFMYPAWPKAKQAQFRQSYQAAGYTHLPLSPWAAYRDQEYDFSDDPEGFKLLIRELQSSGITVCVMAFTDWFEHSHPRSRADLTRWAEDYYPQLNSEGDVKLVCTGWEFNEINGSEWTGDGTEHLEWAKTLRSLFPGIPLYAHFSPERITAWPNYPDHSGPQDEASWWRRAIADGTFTGLLYQRSFSEDEQEVINHTIGGGGDVGDAARIAGTYWGLSGLDFIFFESSREIGRWQRLTQQVMKSSLVKGYC